MRGRDLIKASLKLEKISRTSSSKEREAFLRRAVSGLYLHGLILLFRPLFFYVAFNSFERDISSGTDEIRAYPPPRPRPRR